MNFYSEYGEDRWIDANIKIPASGFYIDVGCATPGGGSNTQFLRDRGWAGLAIDANAGYRAFWDKHHTHFLQAFVSDQPIVRFDFREISTHSRVSETAQLVAAAVPLRGLINRLNLPPVQFLSIDVEGHELAVLRSFEPYHAEVIVVEYNTEGIGEDARIKDYLEQRGYIFRHSTIANHIFTR